MKENSVIGMGNVGYRNSGNHNSGNYNSGNYNSGNHNSGYYNSGDYNSGDYNSGNYNSGDYNSGNYNSGYYNSGNCNFGDNNSGNYNSGYRNSGLFNSCNFSNGIFCSEEPKISIFNIQTDMTMSEFLRTEYYRAILSSRFDLTDWGNTFTYQEACQKWWDGMTEENKEIIKSIPNFNIDIFCKVTGINKKDV